MSAVPAPWVEALILSAFLGLIVGQIVLLGCAAYAFSLLAERISDARAKSKRRLSVRQDGEGLQEEIGRGEADESDQGFTGPAVYEGRTRNPDWMIR